MSDEGLFVAIVAALAFFGGCAVGRSFEKFATARHYCLQHGADIEHDTLCVIQRDSTWRIPAPFSERNP